MKWHVLPMALTCVMTMVSVQAMPSSGASLKDYPLNHTQYFVPGMIKTVAGTGIKGFNGDNQLATKAQLNQPYGIAVDKAGNLFIADTRNERIRVVTPHGTITTLADRTGIQGNGGDGGPAMQAQFNLPFGLSFDRQSSLLIGDHDNGLVRAIKRSRSGLTTQSMITTVAGGGTGCFAQTDNVGDGCQATQARVADALGMLVDRYGNAFIAQTEAARIREIRADTGLITTAAGTGVAAHTGDGGLAVFAGIDGPNELAMDAAGDIYFAEYNNNDVREILATPGKGVTAHSIIRTIAGNGKGCTQQTDGFGDGCLATQASFGAPQGVVVDPAGDIFVSDQYNNAVREITYIPGRGNVITVIAGNGRAGYTGDGGPATKATLNHPEFLCFDGSGNLLISDRDNNAIRIIYRQH